MSITYPITQHSIAEIDIELKPDIFIIGTGASLSNFDFEKLRDKFTIVLNNACRYVPDYNILLHADGIYDRYKDIVLPAGAAVVTQRLSVSAYHRYKPCIFKDKLYYYIETDYASNISIHDEQLYRGIPHSAGHTVATPAILLAWKLYAHRIFLLGVDCYCKNSGAANEKYYINGKNPSDTKQPFKEMPDGRHEQQRHSAWIADMWELRNFFNSIGVYMDVYPGGNVFNLSADSGITAFEKVDIEEVLQS